MTLLSSGRQQSHDHELSLRHAYLGRTGSHTGSHTRRICHGQAAARRNSAGVIP
jgi:hypothetical protein